jgi:hypothetical protein
VLLSTRVFLNVNHDYEIEPEVVLEGEQKSRKRNVAQTAGQTTATGEVGFAPLLVFDLWQRHLLRLLNWLQANPDQGSEVMEAVVRLLSGSKGEAGVVLDTRDWSTMTGCGCIGRFAPQERGAAKAVSAAAGGGGGQSGSYSDWLRAQLAPTVAHRDHTSHSISATLY